MSDEKEIAEGWKRVGEAVRVRRNSLGLRQIDMAERGGPSYETIRLIEKGESGNYQPWTKFGLERALGWRPGTVDDILAGKTGDDSDARLSDYVGAAGILQAAQELEELANGFELMADAYDLDFDVSSSPIMDAAQRTFRKCAGKARERAAKLRGQS